jgi:hypothetical protein
MDIHLSSPREPFDEPDDDEGFETLNNVRADRSAPGGPGTDSVGAEEASPDATAPDDGTDAALIDALASGKSQAEAGRAVGRSDRTVRRRMKDPDFLERLAQARQDHALRQRARSEALEDRATAAIEELLAPDVDPKIRIRAAGIALHWSGRVAQLDSDTRLAILEDRLASEEDDQ